METVIIGINNHGTINSPNIDNRVLVNLHPAKKVPPLHVFENKNKYFYGRDDKIEEIKTAIEERKEETDSFRRTVVLVGFGGMGKSETAKAFAEKLLETYDYIIWIDSQTEQSVEASFRELAERMETEFKSLDDVSKIQAKLTNTYKNGLVIFDNAERLQTADNQLGIENLLFKKFPKNKPIFLATSRNGSRLWGGMNSQIKLIDIDILTDAEATKLLKNYLLLHDREIPPSLEAAISSLVATLGGYPLGLSLVGSTVVEEAEKISFDTIESRIKAYIEILKDVPLREISGEFKYEAALELIFNQTIEKIKSRENGDIAIELLNTMACLNPDGLYSGFVNAIYGETTCESRDDSEVTIPNVKKGLVILKDYSIVKWVNSKRLKIHRLIQLCAFKAHVSQGALCKIRYFFEESEVNRDWEGHIETLIDLLITGVCVDKTGYFLSLLLWRSPTFLLEARLIKSKSYFNVNSTQERYLFNLAEIRHNLECTRGALSVNWEEIETGLLSLSHHWTSQLWVPRALLEFLQQCLYYTEFLKKIPNMDLTPATRKRISSFIINCCTKFTSEKLGILFEFPNDLLRTIYGYNCTGDLSGDFAFLNKLFDSPPTELRTYLWRMPLKRCQIGGHEYSFNRILEAYGLQWFIASLKFTDNKYTLYLCKERFNRYIDNLLFVWETFRNFEKFVKCPEFVNAFIEKAKFNLETTVTLHPEATFSRLSFVILCLFDADTKIHDNYNSCLEPTFQKALKHLKQEWKSERRFGVHRLAAEKDVNILDEFRTKVEKCLWKPKWATNFLEFLATPQLEALFISQLCLSDFLGETFIIRLYNLENVPEGERENCFLDRMFNTWGVDGFTAALNFRDHTKAHNDKDILLFGIYVENLLKVWKTPGNCEKFMKSPDFANAFIREGKLNLDTIRFENPFELRRYLRLSHVIISLFYADKKVYNEFSVSLESTFQKTLIQLQQGLQTDSSKILEVLTKGTANTLLKEFKKTLKKCKWKPKWALKLVKIINSLSPGDSNRVSDFARNVIMRIRK